MEVVYFCTPFIHVNIMLSILHTMWSCSAVTALTVYLLVPLTNKVEAAELHPCSFC